MQEAPLEKIRRELYMIEILAKLSSHGIVTDAKNTGNDEFFRIFEEIERLCNLISEQIEITELQNIDSE